MHFPARGEMGARSSEEGACTSEVGARTSNLGACTSEAG
jgi:hypothetical protein